MAKDKKMKEVNNHPNKIGFKDIAGYTIAESGNMFNLTYITSYLKTDFIRMIVNFFHFLVFCQEDNPLFI